MRLGLDLALSRPGGVPFYADATVALDFANSRYRNGLGAPVYADPSSVSGWSFSRTGTEYESTSSGLLVPSASGVPGITDLGMGVWEARTNALLWSQDFTNAAWATFHAVCSANQTVAPDGTLTADKIAGDNTVNFMQVNQNGATGTVHVAAVYMKQSDARYGFLQVRDSGGSNGASVVADLQAGTLSTPSNDGTGTNAAATITPAANGFYRVSLTTTFAASSAPNVRFGITNSPTAINAYATTTGIYLWQADQNAGASFIGPAIPTTSSSATRGAASASVGLSALSQGTVVGVFSTPPNTSMRALMSLNDGSGSNRIDMRVNLLQPIAFVSAGGVLQANPTSTSVLTAGSRAKMAISWSSAGVNYADSGGYSVSTGAITVPNFTQLQAGNLDGNTGNAFDSTIERLIVYPTKMTIAQVQAAVQ